MRITKSYNDTPKGIQLEFDPELSSIDLKKYLISIGFKNANRNKSVWYIRGVRPSFDRYSSALENANKEGGDLLEVKIEPSYKAIRDNIDHKLFSLVTVSIEFEDQEIKNKHYVVFEDFRVSAEDIANRFLTSHLGAKFKGLKVTAKNFKEKARNAFDEGRIITVVPEIKKVETEKKNTSKEDPKWLITKEAYLLTSGGSAEELKDKEYVDAVAHEHEQLLLEGLLTGHTIPDGILEGYPKLNKLDDFGYSYRALQFKSEETFLKILLGIGNKGEYYTARYIRYDKSKGVHAYVWIGNDVKIVTATNPLLYGGYASRTGVEGKRDTTIELIKAINQTQDLGGELGLDIIGFSSFILSEISYSYTSYTDENGIYTEDHAGDRYETIEIPFSKKAKYKATIRLVKDEHEKFLFAVDFSRNIGTHFSSQGGDISKQRHDQYNFKSEAIRDALKIFIDNIREGLGESYKSIEELYDTRNALKIALIEIGVFAEKHGVFSISELTNSAVKNLDEENLLIDYPEIKSKKLDNNTLESIVEQLIEELAYLEGITENKDTEDLIIGTRLYLEETLSHSNIESFVRDLKAVINRLVTSEEPLPLELSNIVGQYIEKINKLAKLLRVKTLELPSVILTNQDGVYAQETGGDRLEVLEVPFPESAHVNALITIVQGDNNRYGHGLEYHNWVTRSRIQYQAKKRSAVFDTRKQAVQHALSFVIESLHIDFNEALSKRSEDDIYAIQTALVSLNDFASQQGIELPRKDINLNYKNSIEIEKDVSAKRTDSKRAIVQSMIEKLTALEIDTEGETETIIATLRLALEDALQIENEVTFIDSVIQAIEDQKDWINDIEPEAVRNTFLNLILSNAAALGYTPFTVPHSSGYIVEQAWTKLDDKTVKSFEEFINSKPDFITHKYYPEESEPYGLVITSDRDQITFQIFKNNRIAISSHTSIKEGMVYGGSTMSMTKLKKAIRYILSNPKKVVAPEEDVKKAEEEKKYPVTMDINRYGKTIRNVLIPFGVAQVFNSGMYIQDAKKIQEIAPYLLEALDHNLSELTAKELFELVQMVHPNDYGFAVTRSAMLREWEKRGQQIFEELGFPTDAKYPYVNVNTGYRSVYPLQNIIGKFGKNQSWWSAAENYRPIGDLEKAIAIIEEEKVDFKNQQLAYTNPKTGKPKSNKKDKELYREIHYKIEDLENSAALIRSFLKTQKKKIVTEKSQEITKTKKASLEEFFLIDISEAERIRKKFVRQGFTVYFTGKQAFERNLTVTELGLRWGYSQVKLDKKIEKEFTKWIKILTKKVEELEGKTDKKSKQSKAFRLDRISALKRESEDLSALVENEDKVFRDELFVVIGDRVKELGYVINRGDIASFRDYMLKNVFEDRIVENYPNEPIRKMVDILIDDYFSGHKETPKEGRALDYLDKVVAIMHDHYIKGERLSKKKIEAVKEEAGAPNLGVLWEAIELSWLLWYKQIYNLPIPFEQRLDQMIVFWNTIQPTYAYSDSSKELFKQYSTPCPIGAMVAEYTQMSDATRIFEPSAGNGLLVLGADPEKTHVNEIDKSRRYSLELQGFQVVTYLNAAEPFPEEFAHSFDVMVTNPPFASWDDSKFDKERWTQKYFNNQIDVAKHMRLEHFMAGLALHTLKDTGKAAIIIMGHVYFGSDGYIEKYKPFFNWLYRHYNVDDIINMNSYKLYNKQGAVIKTMLILINGRKKTPKGVAPTRKENPLIEQMVNSFPELWERINSHIEQPEQYVLDMIITQLKIELGL
ncbi:Eco57I restriction-modification methylase domain-containing protein [Aquimarina longa]|uniref:Eco57I restriction-modification methylase domain-containing protein n=1 Tax=Aquimarina longa TaxID=1080221 RepID=UPI000783F57E|nr:hypothetical protein [Aquimarina longa]